MDILFVYWNINWIFSFVNIPVISVFHSSRNHYSLTNECKNTCTIDWYCFFIILQYYIYITCLKYKNISRLESNYEFICQQIKLSTTYLTVTNDFKTLKREIVLTPNEAAVLPHFFSNNLKQMKISKLASHYHWLMFRKLIAQNSWSFNKSLEICSGQLLFEKCWVWDCVWSRALTVALSWSGRELAAGTEAI